MQSHWSDADAQAAIDRYVDEAGNVNEDLALRVYTSRLIGQEPTLVLHGEADPLVPVAAGRDIAKHVPGARMRTFPGMGHTLPKELLPLLAAEILNHARR